MRSMLWQLGMLGTMSAFAQGNQEKLVSSWPFTGPSDY